MDVCRYCGRSSPKESIQTTADYGSKAEEQADKILQAVRILQKHPGISLCALDKNLLIGPGPRPETLLRLDELSRLKALGWTWSEEQDAWEFYTGHGG